jgi:hypothetical protein
MPARNEPHDDPREDQRQAADSILAKWQAELEPGPELASPYGSSRRFHTAILSMRHELAQPQPDYARLFLELLKLELVIAGSFSERVRLAISIQNWQNAQGSRRSKYQAEREACAAEISRLQARCHPPTASAIRRKVHELFPKVPQRTLNL